MRLPRLRWRKSRATRGLIRPKPLYVVAGNCMSVSTGPKHAADIFRAYLDTNADVLLLTECSDFRADKVAIERQGEWLVDQPGVLGSPESGTVIAWRANRAALKGTELTLGSPSTSEGNGIRARFIQTADLVIDDGTPHKWRHKFVAGHAPPGRAPKARTRFMAVFAAAKGIRGGDLNLPARIVARIVTRAKVFGVGVLCVCVPRWIPTGNVKRIPREVLADADHDGAGVTLWPKR